VTSIIEHRAEGSILSRHSLPRWFQSLLPEEGLTRDFWVFYAAAFFFELGVGLFVFLFNLFLASSHYNEKFMGLTTGALTLGSVAGTIPVGIAVRRRGLRSVLLFGFVAVPCIGIFRALALWAPAQIGLAFFYGVALSIWPVCFAPTVAQLTTEKNRVSAFSLVFATGIGAGALSGLIGGYLPGLLTGTGGEKLATKGIQLVLLVACAITLFGVVLILKLRVRRFDEIDRPRIRIFHPFLLRFLPAFGLWSVVTGSFMPFAAVFLQQQLGIQMRHLGLIFSASQLSQVAAVLLAPSLYRRWGTITGIMCSQIAVACAVFALGYVHGTSIAVALYLGYMAAQFMSGPGLYTLLMTKIPEEERSTASAIQNITSSLCQAASAAITGICVIRYGYPAVLSGNAVVAVAAALLLFLLLGSRQSSAAYGKNRTA
jgi:MFS family permease